MDKIRIGDKEYDYEIIHKHNKNIYIRFKDGRFIVSAPYLIRKKKIEELLTKDQKKLERMVNPLTKPKLDYQDGITKNILGKPYILRYANRTRLDGDILYLNKNNPKKALLNYVKPLLLTYLEKRVLELYNQMYGNKNVPSIVIKAVKTYYGQYNWKYNQISFNVILSFAPFDIIDYVIIHELCHVRYHNHRSEFHSLLKSFLPDYRQLEKRLKKEVETL